MGQHTGLQLLLVLVLLHALHAAPLSAVSVSCCSILSAASALYTICGSTITVLGTQPGRRMLKTALNVTRGTVDHNNPHTQ